jgi:hypothetical protein
MKEYIFFISLTYHEWLGFYRGHYRELVVTSDQGQKLKIQADHFTQFTTSAGLYGRFKLVITPDKKVASLAQL